jgi:hypothetical protein
VSTTRRPRGQVLVIAVGGMFAVIALVALVVDGGNIWAQQRIVQNGADAAAESGAVVLAEKLAGAELAGFTTWDAKVHARVLASAAANNMTIKAAYYTDVCGIPLQPDGTAAIAADGTENLAVAAEVGGGDPVSTSSDIDCPSFDVGPPAGVLVLGEKNVSTYFAGLLNITTVPVGNRATAVAGYLQGCTGSGANACALLPIAIPVNASTCDEENDLVTTGAAWPREQIIKFPLCGNSPGNIGWLDWTPPGGGTSDTVCSILTPNNPPIELPSWLYAPAAGNTNGGGGPCGMSIEDALRVWDGATVMLAQFDRVCEDDPDQSQVAIGPDYGCPAPTHGGGTNAWYRVPSFAFLRLCSPAIEACGGLHGAYISGSNVDECDSGGNGATSCLIGQLIEELASGTVGTGAGGGNGTKTIGVQLIK